MKTLILVRHGKAVREWDAPSDFARGLIERGVNNSLATAERLKTECGALELALVSPAARSKQTWMAMETIWPAQSVIYDDDLYLAPPEVIYERVSRHGADPSGVVAVIGHNPGLHDFALQLSAAPSEHDQAATQRIAEGFPTAWACRFDRDTPEQPFTLRALITPEGIISSAS